MYNSAARHGFYDSFYARLDNQGTKRKLVGGFFESNNQAVTEYNEYADIIALKFQGAIERIASSLDRRAAGRANYV